MARKKKPVLLTSPFNTVKPKLQRKKQIPWERYPHIPILTTNSRLRRSLLGLRLQWTLKDDGQNVTIWLRKKKYSVGYEYIISSHNQEVAAQDIQTWVRRDCLQDYEKILALIEANPTFRVVAEECAKGASITGIRQYPRATLIVVDIFDTTIMNYLSYTQVYQHCYHYGISIVKLYATTRHRTIKDLIKFSNHVLEYCNTEKEYGKDEGMVVKAFNKDGEYIQAKVKLDIPRPIVERMREGPPKLPQIPESEIYGAIDHAYQELGDKKFQEVKLAMPLVAKMVSEECRKHFYSSRGNLFKYYKEFLERYVNRKTQSSREKKLLGTEQENE